MFAYRHSTGVEKKWCLNERDRDKDREREKGRERELEIERETREAEI